MTVKNQEVFSTLSVGSLLQLCYTSWIKKVTKDVSLTLENKMFLRTEKGVKIYMVKYCEINGDIIKQRPGLNNIKASSIIILDGIRIKQLDILNT